MIDPAIKSMKLDDARRVPTSTPVREAAESLRDPDLSLLLVVDEDDDIVGVVKESDIVALVAETDDLGTVSRCMSSPVVTILPGATVTMAAQRMQSAGVKHLPVVDDEGIYYGVVSRSTLAPYCSRQQLAIRWADEPREREPTDADSAQAHD